MPRLLMFTLGALLSLLAGPAQAEDTYAWLMPPAEQQLAQDSTVIPVGKGAVFVPCVTGPEYEPPAKLVSDEDVINLPLGQRVIVEPGQYVVVVSAGSPAQGVSVAIRVVEGETILVPVTWGALRIEVTDDHRIPHRGSYEIISAESREPIGTGFGADTLQGEILQTWLLKPGLYRIVRVGRDFRALKNYATVQVPESGFVRYRLVLDEDTGEFLGAGVLLPDEFSTSLREDQRWFKSMVVGFDGSLTKSQNVVGAANQTQYSLSGFADAQVSFTAKPHQFSSLFQIDEGVSQVIPQTGDPQPMLKATDRLRGDLLYTYAFRGRRTGPYVRTSAESQALPTEVLATEDTAVTILYDDGTESYRQIGANQTLQTARAGHPTLLREGVGINTTFLEKNRSTNFNLRFGPGMRQNFYDQALVIDDDASTSEVEYKAVETFYEQGIEATIVASVRLPGWVVYSTDIELFADFESFTQKWDRTDGRLGIPYPPWAVSWRNTLSLRITRNLALNYYFNVDIEPQVIDKPQVEHSLLLRTSWAIF